MKQANQRVLAWIVKFAGSPVYPLMIAAAAAADVFIFVVPNDALVISAVLARPERWLFIAMTVTIGSTLGAAAFAAVALHSPAWIEANLPWLFTSTSWKNIDQFLDAWGIAAMFLGSVGPIPLQPFVFAGALAGMQFMPLVLGVFLGRLVKYLVIANLCSRSPEFVESLKNWSKSWRSK